MKQIMVEVQGTEEVLVVEVDDAMVDERLPDLLEQEFPGIVVLGSTRTVTLEQLHQELATQL